MQEKADHLTSVASATSSSSLECFQQLAFLMPHAGSNQASVSTYYAMDTVHQMLDFKRDLGRIHLVFVYICEAILKLRIENCYSILSLVSVVESQTKVKRHLRSQWFVTCIYIVLHYITQEQ